MARARQIVQEEDLATQYWFFVNVDRRVKLNLWPTFCSLGALFWSATLHRLPWLLRLPDDAVNVHLLTGWSESKQEDASELISEPIEPNSKLLALPTDIIKLIFDEIHSLHTAVLMCLSHNLLGSCGEHRVRVYQLLLSKLAPWAGQRLICVGDLTRDDDYPPQLRSYVATWKQSPEALKKDHNDMDWTFVSPMPYDYSGSNGIPKVHSSLRERLEDISLTTTEREKCERLLKWIADVERGGFHQDGRVLCNLSKAEFVRAKAVHELHNRLVTERWRSTSAITLGQALLCMVCWSSQKWSDMNVDIDRDRLSRGRWAGDRFEVVLESRMDAGISWRDVTQEVVDWLEELWLLDHYINH